MGTVRSIDTLSQDDVRISKQGKHSIATRALAQVNALYELLTGGAPVGASTLFFKPHDHSPENGGQPLPRNNVYSLDTGNGTGWKLPAPFAAATWFKLDRIGDRNFALNTSGKPDVSLIPHIVAYASPGIDSGSTNLAAVPCAWEAQALVQIDAGAPSMRFYNRTTGTFSDTQNGIVSTAPQWLSFLEIPVEGGSWNEIDLHFQTTVNPSSIVLLSLTISETRRRSQPASTGTREPAITTPQKSP